jgi:hypothetical protein
MTDNSTSEWHNLLFEIESLLKLIMIHHNNSFYDHSSIKWLVTILVSIFFQKNDFKVDIFDFPTFGLYNIGKSKFKLAKSCWKWHFHSRGSSVVLHLPYYPKVTEVYADTGIIYGQMNRCTKKQMDRQTLTEDGLMFK